MRRSFFSITGNPHFDGLTLALYGVVAILLFFKFKREMLKYKSAVFLFCIGGFFFLLSLAFDLRTVDQFKILLEESAKFFAIGFLLSGYVVIFSDVIKEIEQKIAS